MILPRRRAAFLMLAALLSIISIVTIYAAFLAYRSADLYRQVKTSRRGWSGTVHRADHELGFAPIPGATGAHVFPVGPDIPMRYDEFGFRIPVDKGPSLGGDRPVILTLGCSFTYGDAAYAEDTFPQLVGKALNVTVRNSGVCSYGLAHLVLQARKLIPQHEPDIVVVQYSDWLVSRALSPFSPTYEGKTPSPYFFRDKNGIAIHRPVFLPKSMDLPINHFKETESNSVDAVSFFCKVGFPLFAHDDLMVFLYRIKSILGVTPRPALDREAVIRYAYGEIAAASRENESPLLILILGRDEHAVEINQGLFPNDAVIVDAHQRLLENLPTRDEDSYLKQYAHWRGSPPRIVDRHPNENAHKIVADVLSKAISQIDDGTKFGLPALDGQCDRLDRKNSR